MLRVTPYVAITACILLAACSEESSRPRASDGGTHADRQGQPGSDGKPASDGRPASDGQPTSDGQPRSDATPHPTCQVASGGGSKTVAAPVLTLTLFDRWHEAWLGSPAAVDLDGDGKKEILVPRDELLLGWNLKGEVVFKTQVDGRIWSSPVVADLTAARAGQEIAVAARDKIYAWDSKGQALDGFPVTFRDEMRSLAAGDIDGDGQLELVAVTTSPLGANGQNDIIVAVKSDGSLVPGFPPNTSGAAGCDDTCSVTGGYDQNIALGDVNGDGKLDIFATQDNAYLSLHEGTGRAFDAASIFKGRTKFMGIRFLHDYVLAQQGWTDDEETANQAHFTNSAPAIVDVDGDGKRELVVLASVQNASQSDRLRGVALWVLRPDGTRPDKWLEPFHAPQYLAGLWDFEDTNVVAATNQITVVNLDPVRPGPEFLFAGFDGRIHCVDSSRQEIWSTHYTTDDRVLTGGVVVADLSGDGVPEIVFNSYSPDEGKGKLFILDAGGNVLHAVDLPKRGAMPVPTIADLEGDGPLEIIVSLKDGEDKSRQVLVYSVPGSSGNCLLWPTGRGNDLRNGYVP
jgi:hypothetical protein